MNQARRLPVGAEVQAGRGTHFRVWAPKRSRVEVVIEGRAGHPARNVSMAVELEPEGNGYFGGHLADAGAGTLYRFRLDGEPGLYPDPASRFQPDGPHGPSQVIDPSAFRWTDGGWRGCGLAGQVL